MSNLSCIESKKNKLSLIKLEKRLSIIGSKTVIRETAYVDDVVCGSGSDVPMVSLVTRRCSCGYCDSGVDAVTVDIDVDVDLFVAYSRAVSGQDSM